MTTILLTMLKEVLLSLIGKIAFKAIAERFITRMVIMGLRKLAKMTTNDVDDALAEDLIANLRGKRLPVADGTIK